MINLTSKIHRVSKHPFENAGEETVLLHNDTGSFYGFGPTGSKIWDILGTPLTIDEICAELRRDYDVSAELCLEHVSRFIDKLMEMKLVTVLG